MMEPRTRISLMLTFLLGWALGNALQSSAFIMLSGLGIIVSVIMLVAPHLGLTREERRGTAAERDILHKAGLDKVLNNVARIEKTIAELGKSMQKPKDIPEEEKGEEAEEKVTGDLAAIEEHTEAIEAGSYVIASSFKRMEDKDLDLEEKEAATDREIMDLARSLDRCSDEASLDSSSDGILNEYIGTLFRKIEDKVNLEEYADQYHRHRVGDVDEAILAISEALENIRSIDGKLRTLEKKELRSETGAIHKIQSAIDQKNKEAAAAKESANTGGPEAADLHSKVEEEIRSLTDLQTRLEELRGRIISSIKRSQSEIKSQRAVVNELRTELKKMGMHHVNLIHFGVKAQAIFMTIQTSFQELSNRIHQSEQNVQSSVIAVIQKLGPLYDAFIERINEEINLFNNTIRPILTLQSVVHSKVKAVQYSLFSLEKFQAAIMEGSQAIDQIAESVLAAQDRQAIEANQEKLNGCIQVLQREELIDKRLRFQNEKIAQVETNAIARLDSNLAELERLKELDRHEKEILIGSLSKMMAAILHKKVQINAEAASKAAEFESALAKESASAAANYRRFKATI